MFGVSHDDSLFHKKSYKGQIAADIKDEKALTQTLERFNVFSDETKSEMLQNPVTKDLATVTVQELLLGARQLCQHQLKNTFVEEQLAENQYQWQEVLCSSGKEQTSYIFQFVYNLYQNKSC